MVQGDYVYQYKDHLGNVRLSYSDTNNDGAITPATEIIEESNYYPFGLKHKGYNNVTSSLGNSTAQKFGYNGVELNESLELNLYEMDWRGYDASLGRFMQIDNHAETYMEWSTYHFAANNPIFVADPDGQDWIITMSTDDDGNTTYNITINVAIMNSSESNFDSNKVIAAVKNQFNSAFGISEKNKDGTTTNVNITTNARSITNIDELGKSEHLLEIKNDKDLSGAAGIAPFGGLRLYVKASRVAEAVNSEDEYNTIAHEMGHTGGLYHPDDFGTTFLGVNFGGTPKDQRLTSKDDRDNLMFSGLKATAINWAKGKQNPKINSNQAGTLYKKYQRKELNKQNNYFNIPFIGRVKRNPGL